MSADFLDSNLFIYLFDQTDPRKRGIAKRLIDSALADDQACISYQVVQETLNILTRKLVPPMPRETAISVMDSTLLPLWRVMPSAALYAKGLALQARWQLGWYDALIAAAALEAGCTRLLTEDLQHGQHIESVLIENPFLA
jgi:predicted nucleic acid-binding protein